MFCGDSCASLNATPSLVRWGRGSHGLVIATHHESFLLLFIYNVIHFRHCNCDELFLCMLYKAFLSFVYTRYSYNTPTEHCFAGPLTHNSGPYLLYTNPYAISALESQAPVRACLIPKCRAFCYKHQNAQTKHFTQLKC